ncbi:hypothetical protein NHX12_003231 [Muraenolepis orangiensis]|uniref:ubiquitinyl hydrolase 1 n=1 Tax=Muraenolepis orangiensis TaxID=630683 RepID=A0A9Q0IH11_9TELE|nr:hypothetical protein NHX12_003231 [Muraenolepis orangiensis]
MAGTGEQALILTYYNSANDKCYPFIYLGENGNQNRFANERECMRNCSVNAEETYPKEEEGDADEDDEGADTPVGNDTPKKAPKKAKREEYVNGHAKKHFEENHVPGNSQKTFEKPENVHHSGVSLALCATGLRNLGNTCFMNAILQSLSNVQQFSHYFKELPAVALRSGKTAGRRMYHTRSQGETSVSLVEEVRKTLCSLWQGNQTAFSPDSLFYAIWKIMPSFRGYQQQDAHEFMRYLLDHLHRELQGNHNGVAPLASGPDVARLPPTAGKCCINGITTVVTSIFGGILQNEVNCLICGTESRKFDPFLDCLRSFTDLEELDDAELYMCHKCIKRQKSTKKFWIQKLPKVLCLHLKRFHWTAFLRNKVDTYVEFPLQGLDMRDFLLEVHLNHKVGSGHYTAYGCHEGRWYHFNDSTVTVTSEETVRKAKAYILFYVERSTMVTSTDTAAVDAAASASEAGADEAASGACGMTAKEVPSSHTERDKATVGGRLSTDDRKEEGLDGDPSDTVATDGDSRALPSNAAL